MKSLSRRYKGWDIPVATGIFQADMQVSLINDGPVTFILESPREKTVKR